MGKILLPPRVLCLPSRPDALRLMVQKIRYAKKKRKMLMSDGTAILQQNTLGNSIDALERGCDGLE